MKKLFCILLCLILLCLPACSGTGEKEGTATLSFGTATGDIFPFYCCDKSGSLWRVERNRAYSLSVNVQYFSGSTEKSFLRYFTSTDTALFAYDIHSQDGILLCSLGSATGLEPYVKLAENVRLDYIRAQDNGNIAFIDGNDTLFYMSNGVLNAVEENVAQAEFVTSDGLIYRKSEGTYFDCEFRYPIYSYSNGFRNYIIDGNYIVPSYSDGVAFVIKNRHTVQKRAASCSVAECYVCSDTDVLIEAQSVVLSQFDEGGKHPFLLVCDEDAPALTYKLYGIADKTLKLICENVLSGEYVSADRSVYKYETVKKGVVYTEVIDIEGMSISFVSSAKTSGIFYSDLLYTLENGVLCDSAGAVRLEGVTDVIPDENGLICFVNGSSVYLIKNGQAVLLCEDCFEKAYKLSGNYFYYYTGNEGTVDLAVTYNGIKTALLSDVDAEIGFVLSKMCVAAAKNVDKSLYIVCQNKVIDTGLKINRFLTEII